MLSGWKLREKLDSTQNCTKNRVFMLEVDCLGAYIGDRFQFNARTNGFKLFFIQKKLLLGGISSF